MSDGTGVHPEAARPGDGVSGSEEAVFEYLVPYWMRPELDAWLLSRNFRAIRAPFLDSTEPDALPVILLVPTEEAMAAIKRSEG